MIPIFLILATLASPDAGEAKRRLETRVTVDLKGAAVGDVIETIRAATGLNVVLDPRVPADRDVTVKLRNVPARTVLKHVLLPRNLRAVWRDGVVLVAPRDRSGSTRTTRVYDIRRFKRQEQDFPGPQIELDSDAWVRDGMTCFVFCGGPDLSSCRLSADLIVELIRTTVGGSSWDDDSVASIEQMTTGQLVILQTPSVHREIRALLGRLGEFR